MRNTGVSLAAHPERSGGVGEKQAVAGEVREGGVRFWGHLRCLGFPLGWFYRRRGAPGARLECSCLVRGGSFGGEQFKLLGRCETAALPPCRASGAVLSLSWSPNNACEKPAERGFCEETWGRFDSEKRKSRIERERSR